METLKRIDPSKVPAICIANNVIPVRGTWFAEDEGHCVACACGISAVGEAGLEKVKGMDGLYRSQVDKDGVYKNYSSFLFEATGMDTEYLRGLSCGWESMRRCSMELLFAEGWYAEGILDGRAAWDACVAAGLTREEEGDDDE